MSEWKEYKLGDIAEIVCGATPSTQIPDYWKDEIKWVTAKDVSESNGYKIYETERKISKLGFENCSTKMLPKNTTILIARGATMGRCCMIAEKMALNQTCYALIAKQDLIHSYYLFYLIKSLESHFNNISHGAIFNTVIGSSLKETSVYIPDIIEQKSIASILSSLDDKIDLLHRQNQTLEVLAETLFRQWFVEEPEEGWETGKLGDYVETTLGGEWGKERPEGDYQLQVQCIRGTDIADLLTGIAERAPLRFIKQKKFESVEMKDGDLIMEISGGSDGQSTGRTIYINDDVKALFKYPLVFSNFCRLIRSKRQEYAYFLYSYIRHLYKQGDLFNLENGSSGIRNLDYKALLFQLMFRFPDKKKIVKYDKEAEIYFSKVNKNKQQICTLTRLRDTLLPKLMSGEICIKDSEKLVEAAS